MIGFIIAIIVIALAGFAVAGFIGSIDDLDSSPEDSSTQNVQSESYGVKL